MQLRDWQAKDFEPGAGSASGKDGWIPVEAPGDIYLALTKAGRIAHPFSDMNEEAAAWVGDREWWWRTSFEAPQVAAGETARLVFEGLDTFADVWLNGEKIGSTTNMFVPLSVDVTGKLRPHNEIAIRFSPPIPIAQSKPLVTWPATATSLGKNNRNMIRKAQFGWGWDWGPTLPTVGIWRPVELKIEKQATLDAVKFTTLSLGTNEARVRVDVEFHGTADNAEIVLLAPNGSEVARHTLAPKSGRADVEFTVANPELWWTHDLGKPALYTLRTTLRAGGDVLDTNEMRTGIRTIAIDQSPDPDEPGTNFFRFILNGVSIFARGACWIPASSFVGALTDKDYRWQIEDTARGNMNMLRIWGGGIYEHEAFYNCCDEWGVLVWQDFMFACAPYPDEDPEFVESVKAEVAYQVARLRHHPCLAVWCGNNENQMMYDFFLPPDMENRPRHQGAHFYDEIMPESVALLDPTTPYWPGSPAGGPHANSMRAGDVHNWTVWHGLPPVPDDKPIQSSKRGTDAIAYTRYAEDMTRFVSEYGLHASPAFETLRRAIPPDQLTYRSPAMEHRIKDKPKDKVNPILTTVTGIPETIQQYVDFTQIMQAEGLKFGIEHFRRRMPHCSGSLIWQLNDCWPCVSWSILDYNGFAKAGYFYARRAYAPVMASFKETEAGTELWITNESLKALDGECEIELGDFHTGKIWVEKVAYKVPANTSIPVWRKDVEGSASRYLNVQSASGAFPENRWLFVPIKDLDRPQDGHPKVSIVQKDAHTLAVTITAPSYLYFVHLIEPHEKTRYSDNHFDLRAGQSRTIEVTNRDVALKPEDVTVRSV